MTQDVQPRLSTSPPTEKTTERSTGQKVWTFASENPIFLLALVGLLLGTVVRFGLHLPDPANAVWLATLVLGGAPVVYRTVVGMLHGNFASDVVAMLAIVVAVVMGQSFAGLIIVLMQSGGEAQEQYILRLASSSLEQPLARAPSVAHRKTGVGLECGSRPSLCSRRSWAGCSPGASGRCWGCWWSPRLPADPGGAGGGHQRHQQGCEFWHRRQGQHGPIEQIGRAQAMVFDKTGTLTLGSPTVEQTFPHGDLTTGELLRLTGSAEQPSSHPLALTLTRAALPGQRSTGEGAAVPLPLEVSEAAGGGDAGAGLGTCRSGWFPGLHQADHLLPGSGGRLAT